MVEAPGISVEDRTERKGLLFGALRGTPKQGLEKPAVCNSPESQVPSSEWQWDGARDARQWRSACLTVLRVPRKKILLPIGIWDTQVTETEGSALGGQVEEVRVGVKPSINDVGDQPCASSLSENIPLSRPEIPIK